MRTRVAECRRAGLSRGWGEAPGSEDQTTTRREAKSGAPHEALKCHRLHLRPPVTEGLELHEVPEGGDGKDTVRPEAKQRDSITEFREGLVLLRRRHTRPNPTCIVRVRLSTLSVSLGGSGYVGYFRSVGNR